MTNNLDDKVAIITGATGGIGSAIATEFYNLGAKIVITGRRREKLDDIKSSLTKSKSNSYPYDIHCVALDLEHQGTEKQLINDAIEKFGRIDILVNAAANMDARLFIRTDSEFINKMLLLNFLVPMRLMQQAIPHMVKNRYGRIINITSLASFMGNTGMAAYSATKGALTSLSQTVATEYANRGITVNCIAPGLISTPALKKVSEANQQFIKQQIPAKRFGVPEEIAAIAGHLASEKSSYITGQVIHVNGGLYR